MILKIQNKINIFDIWCPGSPNGNFNGCNNFTNWDLQDMNSMKKINSNNCFKMFKNDSKSLNSCNDILVNIFEKYKKQKEKLNLKQISSIEITKMRLLDTPEILSSISNIYFN